MGGEQTPARPGADFEADCADFEATFKFDLARWPEQVRDIWEHSFCRGWVTRAVRDEGVHPDDVDTLSRWAPLGLTHLCWRNSVVENWHARAGSLLSDGAMFLGNVATTRVFAGALHDLLADWAVDRYACLTDVAAIDAAAFEGYLFGAVDEIAAPGRLLPHGLTLTEVAGGSVEPLRSHAETQVAALSDQVERRGADVVLLWLAGRGLHACGGWWGGTRWPVLVDQWLALLDDPDHPYWATLGSHPGAPPPPADNRGWLRYTLLTGPDRLGVEVAQWCVDAGIRYAGFIDGHT